MRKTNKKKNLKEIILNNIYNNLKAYTVVAVIFLIGVVLGVIFINNINDVQREEIGKYINGFITAIKGNSQVNSGALLKSSLVDNLKLVIGMWFIGSTVIGFPIMLGIVLYRGFCLGYTISAVIVILGMQKGIVFALSTILLQNIIIIPVLIAMAVSGIKMYKSIMKDKRRENIKMEIVRHTIISIISFVFLMISSFVEVYISTNLFTAVIQFF